MRKFLVVAAVGLTTAISALGESYVGAGGVLTLPQGGSRMHRVGGAVVKGGYYVSDYVALEGDAAWQEDFAAIGGGALCHWQGAELYSRFFGYSRFDPFFTIGAKGWLGRLPGQIGPKAGAGAFYHLSDEWALRFDADAVLGLDSSVEMLYSVVAGVQYSF